MKIAVLGITGMLGHTVFNVLKEKYGKENVLGSSRGFKEGEIRDGDFFLDALEKRIKIPDNLDYVINCIGVIKPVVEKIGVTKTLLINSIFPRNLADYCKKKKIRLIHITTDCVFSGKTGNYTEDSPHDVTDVYGRGKSLGEPENCMVLRTSIIGEEKYHQMSLVEWAKSQKGKEVNGYTNHLWNGVTTKQYAEICSQIITQDLYMEGTFHIFSRTGLGDCVSKSVLLHLLNTRFNLQLKIKSVNAPDRVKRTLSTKKELNDLLDIPFLEDQIMEM